MFTIFKKWSFKDLSAYIAQHIHRMIETLYIQGKGKLQNELQLSILEIKLLTTAAVNAGFVSGRMGVQIPAATYLSP